MPATILIAIAKIVVLKKNDKIPCMQVKISMGAIAALTRKQIIWYVGLGIATIGVGFMVAGTLPSQQKAINIKSEQTSLIQDR